MANVIKTFETTNFRCVKSIDKLTDSELHRHGYYRGYQCPHGHEIRDLEYHWCYECVIKIKSNICGFDLNFLSNDFKNKYYKLWKKIDIKEPDECWNMKLTGKRNPNRVCFPSYRTFYSRQKSENVNPHKAIYQCAWGDIGSMSVTRFCGNPWCGNPLHMISSWNCGHPPSKVIPFHIDFDAQKLMRISKARILNRDQEVIKDSYKATIAHPLNVQVAPDYDEG
tara:strand:+ start:533 stop:1204 length:672 start_codon:yes stop_codon:yes gene_type:complete